MNFAPKRYSTDEFQLAFSRLFERGFIPKKYIIVSAFVTGEKTKLTLKISSCKDGILLSTKRILKKSASIDQLAILFADGTSESFPMDIICFEKGNNLDLSFILKVR